MDDIVLQNQGLLVSNPIMRLDAPAHLSPVHEELVAPAIETLSKKIQKIQMNG